MEEITYVFIDGGYLTAEYTDTVRKLFGSRFDIDYSQIKMWTSARRVFYYDCVDNEQRVGENATDFTARVQKQENNLDAIDALEGFHVRRGHLASGHRKQQKEVDVLLAVDMMNHAYSRNMTKAVLISGDRDFRPVVQSVAATGTYVQVMFRKETGSKELGKAADIVEHLDISTLIEWTIIAPGDTRWAHFPTTYHLNFGSLDARDNYKEHNHVLARSGYLASSRGLPRKVRKHEISGTSGFAYYIDRTPMGFATHAFHDIALLEEFITLKYGPVTWTT